MPKSLAISHSLDDASTRAVLSPTGREYIVEGGSSEECIELKMRSREEELLRELGIRHLEHQLTRPRYTTDEKEADILKQAGIRYLATMKEKEEASNNIMKPLSRKEAEVLRSAGVSWLDNIPVALDDDSDCHKLGCETSKTADTSGESTVNSTYAERELLRRLKHGWTSTGEECGECGMPIICKSKGDMLECVICGVIGGEEEENYDPNFLEDSYNHGAESVEGMSAHEGVIDVNTNLSTITPSIAPNDRFSMEEPIYETTYCHECEAPLVEDADIENVQGVYCESCAGRREGDVGNEGDEAYKEELGQRLFDGWELTTSSCPNCNLPLISEGEGYPAICLRCA